MSRLWSACVIVLLLSGTARAQDDSTGTAPEPSQPFHTFESVTVTERAPTPEPRRATGVGFWALGGALGTAMLLDVRSTFDALGRCPRCYEGNPFAAPFVNRGPTTTVSAGLALDVSVMAVAARMKRSPHARFRRIWWVVPAALTTGHVIAYRHNQRIAR
jgi:hypothetical protein